VTVCILCLLVQFWHVDNFWNVNQVSVLMRTLYEPLIKRSLPKPWDMSQDSIET
jgi:hypothetical protein